MKTLFLEKIKPQSLTASELATTTLELDELINMPNSSPEGFYLRLGDGSKLGGLRLLVDKAQIPDLNLIASEISITPDIPQYGTGKNVHNALTTIANNFSVGGVLARLNDGGELTSDLWSGYQIRHELNLINAEIGSTMHAPVQDIPELQAIDTTSLPDKVLILVEDNGQYRFDLQSGAAPVGDKIIAPTVGNGRWIKMSSTTMHDAVTVAASSSDYLSLTAPGSQELNFSLAKFQDATLNVDFLSAKVGGNNVFHAGNSNLPTVNWSAKEATSDTHVPQWGQVKNYADGIVNQLGNLTTNYLPVWDGTKLVDSNAKLTSGNLDVSGKIALNGATVAYRPTAFLGTLIIGNGGTNLLNTTGSEGYYNTFVGIGAGINNTSGQRSTVLGYASLLNNSSGQRNTALGYQSLYYNVTGSYNTALGYASLLYNSSGQGNTAIGYVAGMITNSGADNETSSNSIYIGYGTRASADGNTNETVIGYSAIGNGSNTVTLGNNSVIQTYLQGRVLIGATDNGTDKLQVNGSILGTSYKTNIGATINEFSTDVTLSGNSDTALPTEKAVKTYVDLVSANLSTGFVPLWDGSKLANSPFKITSGIVQYDAEKTFSNPRDIVDKSYVDAVASGNLPKLPVDVATTTNITLSGLQTIDGYAVTAGMRVLVKNQTTASQNGVYLAATGAWTRTTDLDSWGELYKAYVAVLSGAQSGSSYVCNIPASGTLGTTAVTWVLYSAPTNIIAGNGILKTGNTISADFFNGTNGGSANTLSRSDHTHNMSQLIGVPGFGTTAGTIAEGNDIRILNGQTAFGWGNHADAGYLIDVPAFGTTAGTIAEGNDSRINNGQTAFGWGNHADAGYLTSIAISLAGLTDTNIASPADDDFMIYDTASTTWRNEQVQVVCLGGARTV